MQVPQLLITIADVWVVRDIERNPKEHPEKDMIETEQRAKVEVEIRRQVDYLMRQELQRLKEVTLLCVYVGSVDVIVITVLQNSGRCFNVTGLPSVIRPNMERYLFPLCFSLVIYNYFTLMKIFIR